MREITVNGIPYSYTIGKRNIKLRVKGLNGTLVLDNHDVVGVSSDVFDEGIWDKDQNMSVTPGKLADYIEHYTKFEDGRPALKTMDELAPRETDAATLLDFKGLWGCPSQAYVRLWKRPSGWVVIAANNVEGTSVTNSWGFPVDLAKAILTYYTQCGYIDPSQANKVIWLEYYSAENDYHRGNVHQPSYDIVYMKYENGGFRMAQDRHPWRRLNIYDLRALGVL